MLSKKQILIIAIVITLVAVIGTQIWQSFDVSFAEVENTIRSFITALNIYDTDASWGLMSPTLQASYGTKEDFNAFLIGCSQGSWHVALTGISTRSIETKDGITTARFLVTLQIMEIETIAYHGIGRDICTFKLVKIGDEWKIDDWRLGILD